MTEKQIFKRYPAIRCWIKHILEGFYDENERILYSIFGKLKRIRMVTTIINKISKNFQTQPEIGKALNRLNNIMKKLK